MISDLTAEKQPRTAEGGPGEEAEDECVDGPKKFGIIPMVGERIGHMSDEVADDRMGKKDNRQPEEDFPQRMAEPSLGNCSEDDRKDKLHANGNPRPEMGGHFSHPFKLLA